MLQAFHFLIYLATALTISITDVKNRLILNRHLLIFLGFTVSTHLSAYRLENLESLGWVTAICLIFYLLFQGKIGAGDLKLLWVISFWTTGLNQWLTGMSLSWVLGGAFAITYALFSLRRRPRKFSIPFAPFIFLGFLPFI